MPMPTPIFPEASSDDWEARDREERARVIRLMAFAAVPSLIVSLGCALVSAATGWKLAAYATLGTPTGMLILYLGVVWFPRASSEGFLAFLWPNRGEALRETGYSHIQA